MAAISYDTPAILKDFAARHNIDFPLLADSNSQVIGSFGVLNAEAKGMEKGMARPGFFYIGADGVIHEKYFEANFVNRFTASNVIGKLFPELAEEVSSDVEAPHLRLTLGQSDRAIVAGSRVTLVAEIELPPDVHVYAPGVTGYKPIQLVLHSSGEFQPAPATYPPPRTLYLDAIKEQVPVFEGKFRIAQDITINFSKVGAGLRAVFSSEKKLTISGDLSYQACDSRVCYPLTSVPVKWNLVVLPLDLKRSPGTIRHK